MKFLGSLFLAAIAAAAPLESAADHALDVKIERQGNSMIKATVTNLKDHALKLLSRGSILDTVEVERAQVFSGEKRLKFEGIRLYLDYKNLPESAFLELPAGESVESTFDIAQFHNLSDGGNYKIEMNGALQYAEEGSTTIAGAVHYRSNSIEAEVDGSKAAGIYTAYKADRIAKRAVVSSSCTGSRLTAARTALSNCASSARNAAQAARSGSSAKMTEYYKSSSSSTRNTVAGVFDKVASECGSTNSGAIKYECADVSNYCNSGAVAYADLGISTAVFCESYWSFPASGACHDGDQHGIVIHEFTHMPSVKGTDDYGGYGYDFVRSLSAAQNINHADTYMLFANAIRVGC